MKFFLLFVVIPITYTVDCLKIPCPEELAVNITNGIKDGIIITHEKVIYNESNYYRKNDTIFGCICNIRKPCIRKCCGPNEIMVNKNCVATSKDRITFPIHDGTVEINSSIKHHFVHNMKCKDKKMLLMPHYDDVDQFYIQSNGSLYLPKFLKQKMRNPEHYCIENFENKNLEMTGNLSAILCLFEEDLDDTKQAAVRAANVYGMIISMPFLLLTFIAYALLPDRNLHMKALMIYVINLMMGYLLLVIIQLSDTKFAYTSCALIGYFCLFFFMVSFFWMNVICIDIWFTFSGLRGFSGSKKSAERKRFFMYCGYGFGVPSIQVIIVYIIQANASQNSQLSPGIADGQCFLRRGIPELLYFYGPMAILITTNIIFFAITAVKIRNIKKDTSMLKKEDSKRHSYENDKQTMNIDWPPYTHSKMIVNPKRNLYYLDRFNLYLKLLFAMGVNWSMEIISWAVIWKVENAPEYIWYLTDFCNAIYGVFIFFIFVFKRSTWRLLKKRYYSFIGKPHLAHSLTMTNTTRITSYSTNNSSVHENQRGGANDSRMLTSEA